MMVPRPVLLLGSKNARSIERGGAQQAGPRRPVNHWQSKQAALVLSAVLATQQSFQAQAQHQISLALTRRNSHTLTGSPQSTFVANASRDTHRQSNNRSRHGPSRLQQGLGDELELGALTMPKTIAYLCPKTNRLFDNLLLYFFMPQEAQFISLRSAQWGFLAGC